MSRFVVIGLCLGLSVLGGRPVFSAPAPPAKVPKGLLKARLEAARATYQMTETRIAAGQGLPVELFGWSRRWLDAELALCNDKAARLTAMQDHVKRTRGVERITHTFARTGQGRQADANAATYYRTEAEIMLLETGGELPKVEKIKESDEPLPKPKAEKFAP